MGMVHKGGGRLVAPNVREGNAKELEGGLAGSRTIGTRVRGSVETTAFVPA